MIDLDPAEYLPEELFHEILYYLDGTDLAQCTEVSKLWHSLATDGRLWQSACLVRWQGKRYMRRVYRIGINPLGSLIAGKELWKDTPERWKWSYGQVEQEARRTSTTESEIVESYWMFTVLSTLMNKLTKYTNGNFPYYKYPIFELNHTLLQPDDFPEPLTWNLRSDGYFTITRLPPLKISRNSTTWAWTIVNAFCLYVAAEHPGMERRLFGSAIGDCILEDDEEGGVDVVDEAAERGAAVPRRGDGGWVVM